MKPNLSVFSLTGCAFALVPKKSSWNPRSCTFSMLSFRSYLDSHLTIKSVINLELIFVKCVRSVSRFFFSVSGCPYFRKDYPFSTELFLLLRQRSVGYVCVGPLLGPDVINLCLISFLSFDFFPPVFNCIDFCYKFYFSSFVYFGFNLLFIF